ncbi:TM2 domain-containing protein [Carboxylicivirga linearis]|uniref:TM2 domain-containing protein n=1 Tax=Carboxylicivirga linearis TaxID=1628157 RepID=A0ABS5K136_9BACT|nr:TM2 domain-containing protein [Carboxylicivirga linearis]MBS2100256.1 TM2 domain-containing protein [Carboxylicivirga linearis]
MDANNVTLFLAQNSSRFPVESLPIIKKKLEEIDEQRFFLASTQEYRDPIVVLIVSILFGSLGVDRFLIGQTGLGVAKLLTCGGLLFWMVVDWFIIMDAARESNLEKFLRVV